MNNIVKQIDRSWNLLNSLNRTLLRFSFIAVVCVYAITILVSLVLPEFQTLGPAGLVRSTALPQLVKFLTFSQTADSWNPMFAALDYLQSPHQEPVYEKLFFSDQIKFQYPLTSLLSLLALRQLLPSTFNIFLVLNILTWLSIPITIFFAIKLFGFWTRNGGQTRSELDHNSWITTALIIALSLVFYPFIKSYGLGQIQTILNCLFAAAMWSQLTGKERLSGLLIGLMVLIKPQYGIILIWGCLRRKWLFSAAMFLVALSGSLFSILIFGISENLGYLKVLSFISRRGEIFYPNQSINGLLNRLLFNGNSLEFTGAFPPYNPIVYIGTFITSILLLVGALFYVMKLPCKGNIIDFAIVSITCTVASPVAWEHHYGILLPIYAFFLSQILNQSQNLSQFLPIKKWVLYSSIAYILSSSNLRLTNYVASIPILNILQSYLFFSVLILLGYLYTLGSIRQQHGFDLASAK